MTRVLERAFPGVIRSSNCASPPLVAMEMARCAWCRYGMAFVRGPTTVASGLDVTQGLTRVLTLQGQMGEFQNLTKENANISNLNGPGDRVTVNSNLAINGMSFSMIRVHSSELYERAVYRLPELLTSAETSSEIIFEPTLPLFQAVTSPRPRRTTPFGHRWFLWGTARYSMGRAICFRAGVLCPRAKLCSNDGRGCSVHRFDREAGQFFVGLTGFGSRSADDRGSPDTRY